MKKKAPSFGDIRAIAKFAFFPIRIYKEVKWLKMCYILQAYRITNYWNSFCFMDRASYLKYKKGL